MSPRGTEQTLDLIKLAPPNTCTHKMWHVHIKYKYPYTQCGNCILPYLLFTSRLKRSIGVFSQTHTQLKYDQLFPTATEVISNFTQGHLTASNFCIRNKAGGCEPIRALLCCVRPSCPETACSRSDTFLQDFSRSAICPSKASVHQLLIVMSESKVESNPTTPNESLLQFKISLPGQIKITILWQTAFR